MTPEEKLQELGIELPEARSFHPAMATGRDHGQPPLPLRSHTARSGWTAVERARRRDLHRRGGLPGGAPVRDPAAGAGQGGPRRSEPDHAAWSRCWAW